MNAGHNCKTIHMASREYTSECLNSDVIIYYRCYNDQSYLIKRLCEMGKLVIYDIDDYVFQVGGRFNSSHEIKMISQYFNSVNCYTASTETLLAQMPKNNKPRFVRENFFNNETFKILSNDKYKKPRPYFRIGWTVGINRREMQDYAKKFLRILNKMKLKEFEFYYFGKSDDFYRFTKSLDNIKCRRLDYVPTAQWKELYKIFTLSDFDVVVNPLDENDVFFNCKSGIKFLEVGAMGVPLVVSRVKPFTEIIEEGFDGMFASTPKEMVEKILHLKNNPEECKLMGQNAREKVKRLWLTDSHIDKFVDNCYVALSKVKTQTRKSMPRNDYVEDISQENFGYVTGAILEPLVYEFKCSHQGLCRIELLGSVDKSSGNSNTPLKMVIKNKDTNSVCFSRVYNLKDFPNDSWWGFEFPPVADSEGCHFTVTLIPDVADGMSTFSLFLDLSKDKNKSFLVGGTKKSGSLAFKSYCSKFVHELPPNPKPTIKPSSEVVSTFTPKSNPQSASINCLFKRKGGVSDLMALIPVLREYKNKTSHNIYVATNHQSLFKDIDFIDGTIPWSENMAGIGKRVDLDGIEYTDPSEHLVNVYAKKIMGHDSFKWDYFLPSSSDDVSFVEEILFKNQIDKKKFIVMHKGVGSKNRSWPKSKWDLLETNFASQGQKIVLVGQGSDHKPINKKTLDLTNKLSPHHAKILIEKADKFVGPDGDYLALAGATETPIFGLFFGTEGSLRLPYRNGEIGANSYAISPHIDCFGCWHKNANPRVYHGCIHGHFKCNDLVTPKMVLNRVNSI